MLNDVADIAERKKLIEERKQKFFPEMKVNVAGIFLFYKIKEILIKRLMLTSLKKILKYEITHGIYMESITCQLKKLETISKKILILKYNGLMIHHAILYLIQHNKLLK